MRRACRPVFLLLSLCIFSLRQLPGQALITTAVGSDLFFQGNGKPAISVPLGRISRVATDSSGRPVFADPNYNLVFQVNTDGTIQAIAGNNVQGLANLQAQGPIQPSGGGYSGDGGLATQAALNRPSAAIYDPQGNLYIADTYNQMIRVVSPQKIIQRYAGNGQAGYADGPNALNAMLSAPMDLALDPNGNLYVNDTGNQVIRKITPQGVISTVAGTNGNSACSSANNVSATSTSIGTVLGMAVDAKGNLYFTECARVREISGGILTTLALPSQNLQVLSGIAFDSTGALFIADKIGQMIYKFSGTTLTPIAGTGQIGFSGDGPALSATFQDPFGLAVKPTGEVLVADVDNLRVRQIDTKGGITTIASNGALISSQNGVTADLATLNSPYGINFDRNGAMLIADTVNNIVRRLGSGQVLSTIAGTGAGATSRGDNGPATQASLAEPVAVVADSSGDLFISEYGTSPDHIRKVAPNGSITTFASLSNPYQSALDSSGNLYVADYASGTVVKIAPNGAQSPAINNLSGPVGLVIDNVGNLYVSEFNAGRIWRYSVGPAGPSITQFAKGLDQPAGLALDSTGNLYVADFGANLVRMIAPNGTITTIAGNGAQGFSGDNGPATSAALFRPFSLAFDSSGALYVADMGNNRIREILLTSAPKFSADAITLSLPQAASNGSVTQPVTDGVSATLNGAAFRGLLFSVSADQPWLQASASDGAMPAQLSITGDPTGLAPGSYTGHVVISAPGAAPSTQSIAVSFTVAAAQLAELCLSPRTLSFAFTPGAAPQTTSLSIQNAGSGTGNYSIATCGAPWLAVSPAQGTVAANSPATVNVTVTPAQLSLGTSLCNLTVTGGGYCDPLNPGQPPVPRIPVSASINTSTAQLQLSQTGILFPAIAAGGAPLPRSFGVSNAGGGQMTWTAAVSTTSGGSWLSVSPSSGTVVNPATDVSQVTVMADPTGLAANTYYGSVTVSVNGLAPQSVTIVLNVQAPGTAPAIDIYPASLVFASAVQGVNPSSQTVSIANLSAAPLTFTSSRLPASGDPSWFVPAPAGGTINPNQPIALVVQPDFSSLAPGAHQGTIALRFSDTSTGSISVQTILQSASPSFTGRGDGHAVREASCAAVLYPTVLNQQPVAVSQGRPTTLQVQIYDACKNTLNSKNADVYGILPAGSDPQRVNLSPSATAGVWEGTWTPNVLPKQSPFNFQMTADATVNQGDEFQVFNIQATIVQTTSTPAPTIVSGGVVNAASNAQGVGVALAPCSLVTIYGDSLADGSDSQEVAPLPVSLANTQLQWADQSLHLLYASGGQVNAQVPCELQQVDTTLQIKVNRGGVLSQPNPLPTAAFSPAIFTVDQTGQGQASVLDYGSVSSPTLVVLDAKTPAHAGDFLAIYCTGLGAVNPPVPTGQPAGGSSVTTTTPTVTIGGINAPVTFSGMAPGYAGLYQVNVTVPQGITPGTVPLVISIGNMSTAQYQNVTILVQ